MKRIKSKTNILTTLKKKLIRVWRLISIHAASYITPDSERLPSAMDLVGGFLLSSTFVWTRRLLLFFRYSFFFQKIALTERFVTWSLQQLLTLSAALWTRYFYIKFIYFNLEILENQIFLHPSFNSIHLTTMTMKRLNSVSVAEENQLTLTWHNVVVKYHPQLTMWDKLLSKTPGEPKTLLKGGKYVSDLPKVSL